jgi:hypothetical protein
MAGGNSDHDSVHIQVLWVVHSTFDLLVRNPENLGVEETQKTEFNRARRLFGLTKALIAEADRYAKPPTFNLGHENFTKLKQCNRYEQMLSSVYDDADKGSV